MIRVAIVTVSDSAAAGTREDRSGPEIAARAGALGWEVREQRLIPDEVEAIAGELRTLCDAAGVDVIFTTGGTGIALRDVTPEATRIVLDREIPGLPELMRAEGRKSTQFAPLSRAAAGTKGSVLIINLPGSPKGAVESLDVVAPLIPHMVDLLQGRTGHEPSMRN